MGGVGRIEFTPSALGTLARMSKADRAFVLEGIRTHLMENDASELTRNKFLLKRPSAHAERELRLREWRVFYSVHSDHLVVIHLVGRKHNNKLLIDGEEFEL